MGVVVPQRVDEREPLVVLEQVGARVAALELAAHGRADGVGPRAEVRAGFPESARCHGRSAHGSLTGQPYTGPRGSDACFAKRTRGLTPVSLG